MKSPYRNNLDKLIRENQKYICGLTLNVGGGKTTYRELADQMITMDKYDANPSGSKLDVDVKADAEKQYPFPDNKFDSLVCTQVLEHVPDPLHIINENYRVLKQDGYLILSVPFLERYHADPHDYWRFTHQGLKKILEPNFEIIKMEPVGGRYLLIQNFLFIHGFNKPLFRLLQPLFEYKSKKENNKIKWAPGILVISKRK